MKRFLLKFIAICFPWLIMLIKEQPFKAIFLILLQFTMIGWIPASIIAMRAVAEA